MINKLLFITIIFILIWITIFVISEAVNNIIKALLTKDIVARENLEDITKLYDVYKIENKEK